ncbi:hypothetical protein, partial [Cronobacter sakazakii]|uniref:hypothetical protein n=1 Tax=Cronobacter sakazakii TaxID=28141 RepID=UPI001F2AE9F1
ICTLQPAWLHVFLHDKREAVNKFVNCIGAQFTHLILSGKTFACELSTGENDFRMKALSSNR